MVEPNPNDPKDVLRRYLTAGVVALRWKVDGLSEYDVRRPLTPTGTNLLGLLKHVAYVALGYFGDTFDRPHGEDLRDIGSGAEPNADLWAAEDESFDDVIGLWVRAWAHSDATIVELELDAVGRVPWWPPEHAEVTLQRILVHMATEVHRHAGHADVLREQLDGTAGLRDDNDNLWIPENGWEAHRARLQALADRFS
ncbi:MAG: DinB family protein [Actinomycetota bacterium]